METRNRQLASKAFLIAALVLFVAFHWLPIGGEGSQGFHMWLGVRLVYENPKLINEEPWFVIGMASFLNVALLTLICPFLASLWAKSHLAWCCATTISGLAATGFGLVFLFVYPSESSPNWGGWFMLLAPLLNFYGLLLARGKTTRNPAPPAI